MYYSWLPSEEFISLQQKKFFREIYSGSSNFNFSNVSTTRAPEIVQPKTRNQAAQKFSPYGNESALEYYRHYMNSSLQAYDSKKKAYYFYVEPYRPAEDITLLSAFEFPDEIHIVQSSINNEGATVYCRYFDEYSQEISTPFKSFFYTKYVVYCPRIKGTKKVSLSHEADSEPEIPIPMVDRTNQEPKHFFGVCLCPVYGNEPKWLMLTELIEHYKMQGATHFYIYIRHMAHYDKHILNDYVRTGEVEVVTLLERHWRIGDYWQHIGIQDCMLRSRGFSKWNAFADVDERLTALNGTILQYLKNIKDPLLANDRQVIDWMPTNRYHNTSSVGAYGHTTKCIVDTQKALIMGVHYVLLYHPGYYQKYIEADEGVVRHYRDVNMSDWGTRWLKSVEAMGNFSMTNYPENLQKELTSRVVSRIRYVYKTDHLNETKLSR
ncbi:unnamed protein product [Caenorhabditis auriculariae]|uniref:Glycosyltransferase family 92 protein n=1 Tax=Caenorhabditis auriculariae TaxID=2777116 RepID=A0A8S1HGI6_9PELO|nr:unnamed protein product [Caenorhabditis auriculariae]